MIVAAEILNSGALRVLAYLCCALMCAIAGRREREAARIGARVLPGFWWTLAACLMAFGVAREIGLGGVITEAGRHLARANNDYADRRPVQRIAIECVLVGSLVLAVAALTFQGERWKRYRLPGAVAVLLCGYIAVRAISLHNVDYFLYHEPVAGVTMSAAIELFGVLLLTAVAAWSWLAIPAPKTAPG
jgi:hypothetical protein